MSSSSPFPRFLSVFIVLGIAGLVFIAGLPILIASSFDREAERFELCQRHLRYDCDPSIMWVLRGFTEALSTSTSVGTATGAPSPDGTDAIPDGALRIISRTVTASSTPTLFFFQSDQLVRNGDAYRATPGSTVKFTLETQDAKTASVFIGSSTSTASALKDIEPGKFSGSIKLPKTLPIKLHIMLKDSAKLGTITIYQLSVASNQ